MQTLAQSRPAIQHDRQSIQDEHPGTVTDLRWLAPVVLVSAIFVYLQSFIRPSTPILLLGDQTIYLHHATRMLDGQLIYRDYDHFTLPGTDVLYMALFRVFGVRSWIAPAMLVLVGSLSMWTLTIISGKLLKNWTAFLPGILFVTLPFAAYLDATHHWYSTLFSLGALAVLIGKRTPARLIWAGILTGLATFFTQSTALVAVGFALFLLWEARQERQAWNTVIRKEAYLLISFVGTLVACLAYFVRAVGLRKFFYYTVAFVMKYYSAEWFNTWRVYLHGRPQLHHPSTWTSAPAFVLVHLIVPFIYFPFLVLLVRGASPICGTEKARLMLVSLTGSFLFLSIAAAPAASRLYTVSAPAIILLVAFLDSRVHRRAWLGVFWTTVLVLAVGRPLATQLRWRGTLDLPIGRTAFVEPLPYEKCQWLLPRTRPFDYFFNDPTIAFALRLRNVSRVPTVRPTEYTRPEEVQDTIQALDRFQVRFVFWAHELDGDREAARRPGGDHLGPLRQYLRKQYHIARTFSGGDQTWEHNSYKSTSMHNDEP